MSIFRRKPDATQYKAVLIRAFEDGVVTPAEWAAIRNEAVSQGMTVDDIRLANVDALNEFSLHLASDGWFDLRDSRLIETFCKEMGVDFSQASPAVKDHLAFQYWLTSASTNLNSIALQSTRLRLQPGEVPYLEVPASIVQMKATTHHIGSVFAATSFRVARGVRFITGASRPVRYSTTAPVVVSSGSLVVTSQRIAYMANAKGFNKKWSEVAGMEPYLDALELYFTNRQASTLLTMHPRDIVAVSHVSEIILNMP